MCYFNFFFFFYFPILVENGSQIAVHWDINGKWMYQNRKIVKWFVVWEDNLFSRRLNMFGAFYLFIHLFTLYHFATSSQHRNNPIINCLPFFHFELGYFSATWLIWEFYFYEILKRDLITSFWLNKPT